MIDITNLVANKKFGCKILLHRDKGKGPQPELKHFWTGLPFEIYNKYTWYFRYRAALLQVQYPLRFVELENFQYEYIPTDVELKKRLKDKIIGNKAKLTTWRKKVDTYEKEFIETEEKCLFPAQLWEDEAYKLALAKILALESKIALMEAELLNFNN